MSSFYKPSNMTSWGYDDLNVADLETKLLTWINEHSDSEVNVTGPGMNSIASFPALEIWSKQVAKLGRQLMTYAFGLSRMRGKNKITSNDIELAYRILTKGIANGELELELARAQDE